MYCPDYKVINNVQLLASVAELVQVRANLEWNLTFLGLKAKGTAH